MSVLSQMQIKKKVTSSSSSINRFPVAHEAFVERYIDISILGNKHHIKLLHVKDIISHEKLGKYLNITNCAFLHYEEEDVLAVDIRKSPTDIEAVTVVVAEVICDGKLTLMGFVINDFEEFCEKISFSEVNRPLPGQGIASTIVPAFWWVKK